MKNSMWFLSVLIVFPIYSMERMLNIQNPKRCTNEFHIFSDELLALEATANRSKMSLIERYRELRFLALQSDPNRVYRCTTHSLNPYRSIMHLLIAHARKSGDTQLLTHVLKSTQCKLSEPTIPVYNPNDISIIFYTPWEFIIRETELWPSDPKLKQIKAAIKQAILFQVS